MQSLDFIQLFKLNKNIKKKNKLLHNELRGSPTATKRGVAKAEKKKQEKRQKKNEYKKK